MREFKDIAWQVCCQSLLFAAICIEDEVSENREVQKNPHKYRTNYVGAYRESKKSKPQQ